MSKNSLNFKAFRTRAPKTSFQIQEGRELYLDKFSRKGSEDQTRYVVGQRNGITSATIL